MRVPFFDLKRQSQAIKCEVLEKFEEVIDNTAFSSGPFVEEFEDAFGKYLGIEHVVALNSGTSALHLSMIALGIGRDDEVILPSLTFVATAWAVVYVGAKPVFVDVQPDTWQIDPDEVRKRITKKTKAIIGVHIYGQPFNVEEILDIAKENGLYLVEDAAQAHGATFKGKKVGTFGDIGTFSFYPSKNLGSWGEGGAIATHDGNIARRVKILRNQGSEVKYEHVEVGYNMRMTGFQGALLSIKLKYLDAWNERRRMIARRYMKEIDNPKISFQKVVEGGEGVYHLFVVKVDDRKEFTRYLESKGVGYALHYPKPVHKQKPFLHLNFKLPITEELCEKIVSIPMFPEMTDEEVDYVIDVLRNY